MKTVKLTVTLLLCIGTYISAAAQTRQPQRGIYLTAADFAGHKLSYAADQNSPQQASVNLHQFFSGKSITVYNNGKNITLLKTQVYGYTDDNRDYRFFNNRSYTIIDTAGFYIYSFERLAPQGKGQKPTKAYFFSTLPDREILPLTVDNLVERFVANKKFGYMVQSVFKSDAELLRYNRLLKGYKLKDIYKDSLK